jgi:hypothetical protein
MSGTQELPAICARCGYKGWTSPRMTRWGPLAPLDAFAARAL